MKAKILGAILVASFFMLHSSPPAFAQGMAFTYQGRLDQGGAPANGIYDLRFAIYDSTNSPGNVVAGPLTNRATGVTNGLFCVTLDFGPGVFHGAGRWLDIAVRTAGVAAFSPLAPRQPLTPAPYAIMAGSASNLLGALPAAQLSGTVPSSSLSGTYTGAVTFGNAANQFYGNGSGLTALNATSLNSGSIADVRLSTNVALLNRNQSFLGTNLFARLGIGVANPAAPLQVVSGGASGLTDFFQPGIWGDATRGDGVFGSSSATNGFGVYGSADRGTGVYGDDGVGSGLNDSFTPAVWGNSSAGDGVFGSTSNDGGYGVYGRSIGAGGTGIYGEADASDGSGVSAWGATNGTALTIVNGGIRVAGAGVGTSTAAFIQKVTPGNVSGNSTKINNPLCNSNPNVLLTITPSFNPGGGSGVYDNHVVGVSYDGAFWWIFNEDSAAMPVNAAFNVLVINP